MVVVLGVGIGVAVAPAGVVPVGWGAKDQSVVGELTGVVDFVAGNPL
ncbi:hypothetical protein KSF_063890 [Reticulibacter mediterranei]|uniref:Uncharacterized protein n=1 Tax=Reticulibacter mediterranei TaxID=2778369 RepID=A0A8J3IKT9_9CHLR|nr:hypothetical protein KSF_063890 [Reticulibacter mediterranei]